MAKFTVKPSSKKSVKAASTVVPGYDAGLCHDAFCELVDMLGEESVLDEIMYWMPSAKLAEFVQDVCNQNDILLEGFTEEDAEDFE